MDVLQHLLGSVRSGDRQHLEVRALPPFLGPRRPVTITLPLAASASPIASTLLDRRVDEAAGVDDNQIGPLVRRRDEVASARNLVRICSESTSALGQPRDTNPTVGSLCVLFNSLVPLLYWGMLLRTLRRDVKRVQAPTSRALS